jgi:hypothetical protein
MCSGSGFGSDFRKVYGIPASGSDRYRWSWINPALPSYAEQSSDEENQDTSTVISCAAHIGMGGVKIEKEPRQ